MNGYVVTYMLDGCAVASEVVDIDLNAPTVLPAPLHKWHDAPMPPGTIWCGMTGPAEDGDLPPYAICEDGSVWKWVPVQAFKAAIQAQLSTQFRSHELPGVWTQETDVARAQKATSFALKSSLRSSDEVHRFLEVAWDQLPIDAHLGTTPEQRAHANGRCLADCGVCKREHVGVRDPAKDPPRISNVEVTLIDGEPVVTLGVVNRFRLTADVAADLARKLAAVLEFPWTNRTPIALPCPRHPTLCIGCGATCLDCHREALAEEEESAS